jgi:pseudo-rSAM protein
MGTFPFDGEKRYCLIVDPLCYLSARGSAVLLYNPLSGRALFSFDAPRLAEVVAPWMSGGRAPVLEVSGKELVEDDELRGFVETLRDELLSYVVEAPLSSRAPFQFPPSAGQQQAFLDETAAEQCPPERGVLGLSIYLNGECRLQCGFCTTAYRQFPCCGMFDAAHELDARHLERILRWVGGRRLSLAFFGGDVFRYPDLGVIGELLAPTPAASPTRFHAHCLNVLANIRRLATLAAWGAELAVLVPSDVPDGAVADVWEAAKAARVDARMDFVLEKNEDYFRARRLEERLGVENLWVRPLYNGRNQGYFEENVFVRAEEILTNKPALGTICANAVVNRSAFGRLFVSSSGDLYASPSAKPLGNIAECSVAEAASRELADGHVWKRTRGQVEPCRDCVFQHLCPPVTGYEEALGRNDLCHVRSAYPGKGLTTLGASDPDSPR